PPVGAAAGAGAGAAGNFTRNATINYELDKTVRHTRGAPGAVKRLSVAVAVNHKRPPGSDGRPGKPVAPSAEELKRIEDLVRESVGFNEQRGDTINVAAASFVLSEVEALPETPPWQDPVTIALAKEAGKYLVFALIALLVWAKLLKPVFEMFAAAAQRAEAERKAAATAAAARQSVHAGGIQAGRPFEDKLQGARDAAKQEPKLVADLIKEWMGGNGT
ncbi:MAG: flagellar basal body M-ring protein FliF, partial [Sulfuritalea sp.]|nr:flagellar basal body M-ring protein FliF [Sulfuritalea sp.]